MVCYPKKAINKQCFAKNHLLFWQRKKNKTNLILQHRIFPRRCGTGENLQAIGPEGMIQVENILTGFSSHFNCSESAKTCLRLKLSEVKR